MLKRMGKKAGDTLIEVTLAVGIFSMIAVVVVSVVNGSASSAQVALETTLAREEIDMQAEALRFIQNSYILSSRTEGANIDNHPWKVITSKALDEDEVNALKNDENNSIDVLAFKPNTCDELYGDLYRQNAFVINTRNLNAWSSEIVLSAEEGSSSKFYPASTYPRVIYSDDNSLIDANATEIYRVEGIYVVAIKDQGTTNIASGNSVDKKSAYYDFYIRTCWYGSGADRPSTISTVIRLYDPDAVEHKTQNTPIPGD